MNINLSEMSDAELQTLASDMKKEESIRKNNKIERLKEQCSQMIDKYYRTDKKFDNDYCRVIGYKVYNEGFAELRVAHLDTSLEKWDDDSNGTILEITNADSSYILDTFTIEITEEEFTKAMNEVIRNITE